jgi:site-specific DNA-methyltransferase (adenine-specific)
MPDELNNAIIKPNNEIEYSGFILNKTGVTPKGTPNFEQWKNCWTFANSVEGYTQWWIGDLMILGEEYGEEVTQYFEGDGHFASTRANYKYVSSRVPASRRREALSWSIHSEVASFGEEEQERLLQKAEELSLTQQQLRKEKHRLALDAKRQPLSIVDQNIILGDAVVELENLPDKSIDCLITDPPYGIDYQSNRRVVNPQLDKLSGDTDEAFLLLDTVCEIIKRKIKDNSHLYFFTSWKVYSRFETIIKKYFEIVNVLIWDKLNHGSGDLEGNYGERYEMIIFASNGRRILNGDREDNIISYSRVVNQSHPTEKPVGLIKKLIEKSTNLGELVVDPFCGSGSTCIAAKLAGRKYFGIEVDEQWFALAQIRAERGE